MRVVAETALATSLVTDLPRNPSFPVRQGVTLAIDSSHSVNHSVNHSRLNQWGKGREEEGKRNKDVPVQPGPDRRSADARDSDGLGL